MFEERPPPAGLKHLIQAVWTGGDAASGALILPDGCTDLVFEPGRRTVRVTGPMSRAIQLPRGPARPAFGIRFEPWAAAALLGKAVVAVRDRNLSLEALQPRLARALRGVSEARVALQIVGELLNGVAPDGLVQEAVRRIRGQPGTVRVQALARSLDISPRQLQRLVVSATGLAPKALMRVERLRAALAAHGSLAAVAASFGFADQAHLSREARSLTGASASRLISSRRHALTGATAEGISHPTEPHAHAHRTEEADTHPGG